jgi:hypothetical protein
MRRGLVAFFTLTLVGLALTGCGLFRFEQREPWRAQAEEACLKANLVQPSAYMSRTSKIEGPGACGMDYPFAVAAFAGGSVGVSKQATLACPAIATIDAWVEEIVKPAAMLYYGTPVVDLRAGSYACRPRNNQRGAKYSEHAFGNAMDVMAFQLADGREITVVKGWRGDPVDQEFLREVFLGACRYFTTVLGPGADAFHYDHFHVDLARHDPRGERRICKPKLNITPRIEPGVPVAQAPSADLAPIDYEEDAPVDAGSSRQPARSPAPVYSSARPAQSQQPVYSSNQPVQPQRPLYPSSQPVQAQQPVYSSQPTYRAPASAPMPPDPYRGAAVAAPLPPDSYRGPQAAGRGPMILNGHTIY